MHFLMNRNLSPRDIAFPTSAEPPPPSGAAASGDAQELAAAKARWSRDLLGSGPLGARLGPPVLPLPSTLEIAASVGIAFAQEWCAIFCPCVGAARSGGAAIARLARSLDSMAAEFAVVTRVIRVLAASNKIWQGGVCCRLLAKDSAASGLDYFSG